MCDKDLADKYVKLQMKTGSELTWCNYLSLADNKADIAHFLSEELYLQSPKDKEIIVAEDLEKCWQLSYQNEQFI